jgi:hypothetical protein
LRACRSSAGFSAPRFDKRRARDSIQAPFP